MRNTVYRVLLGLAFGLTLFADGVFASAITVVALGLAIVGEYEVYKKGKVKLCDAHVYKHLELGTLLYCDAEQATHTNYQYLGTAKVKCENLGRCSLS